MCVFSFVLTVLPGLLYKNETASAANGNKYWCHKATLIGYFFRIVLSNPRRISELCNSSATLPKLILLPDGLYISRV